MSNRIKCYTEFFRKFDRSLGTIRVNKNHSHEIKEKNPFWSKSLI